MTSKERAPQRGGSVPSKLARSRVGSRDLGQSRDRRGLLGGKIWLTRWKREHSRKQRGPAAPRGQVLPLHSLGTSKPRSKVGSSTPPARNQSCSEGERLSRVP